MVGNLLCDDGAAPPVRHVQDEVDAPPAGEVLRVGNKHCCANLHGLRVESDVSSLGLAPGLVKVSLVAGGL